MSETSEKEVTDSLKKERRWPAFVWLQVGLFIFSLGGVCSKMAGRQDFLSFRFFLFYGLLILILFIYAIIWQQVLKKIPLTVAYACKGIGIFYGILWGVIVFGEELRANMLIGAVLVLIGSMCFLMEDARSENKEGENE
ncbi:MAG: transporter [Lachnospiraceae bacterium]|nr:transporter [Lachnospiraceae bacterium]